MIKGMLINAQKDVFPAVGVHRIQVMSYIIFMFLFSIQKRTERDTVV